MRCRRATAPPPSSPRRACPTRGGPPNLWPPARCSQEADEYDLPLLKARGRRKSKDLEEQAMALLGPQLEKIFGMIDVSGDGQLDPGELKQAFELAGKPKSDAEIEQAIKELDEDGDGLINLEEFKKIA